MKYKLTSSEAAKLQRKILQERDIILVNESQSCVFNASLGEDVESARPAYDYEETQRAVEICNRKIRALKHAINCFNSVQLVGDTMMTIDQVLVYLHIII